MDSSSSSSSSSNSSSPSCMTPIPITITTDTTTAVEETNDEVSLPQDQKVTPVTATSTATSKQHIYEGTSRSLWLWLTRGSDERHEDVYEHEQHQNDSSDDLQKSVSDISVVSSKVGIGSTSSSTLFFDALILSMWDNIMGPCVQRAWLYNDNVSDDTLAYIAKHTLNCEVFRPDCDNTIETKFYVFPDIGAISTFIFIGDFNDSPHMFSLSLLFPLSHISSYLRIHYLTEDTMHFLIAKARVLLSKCPLEKALTLLSSHAQPCVQDLTLVSQTSIPHPIDIPLTAFSSSFDKNIFHQSLLRKAILSHMQTGSCSIVTGLSVVNINVMLNTLALFSSSADLRMSRLASSVTTRYQPGLFLQGIVLERDADLFTCGITDERVIKSPLPTTLVDLRNGSVQQTNQYNEYKVLRDEFIEVSLQQLVTDIAGENCKNNRENVSSVWTASNGLFHYVKDANSAIRSLLVELAEIEPMNIRMFYIERFCELQYLRAISLVKYIESKLAQSELLLESSIKQFQSDLELTNDSDFKVVLSLAEKFRPGTFTDILGDPRIMEDKLQLMMEAF